MTKEEIIANLYSLRAGLSVVTQEKRYIDKQKKIAEENERSSRTALDDERTEKISQTEMAIKKAQNELESAQSNYDDKELLYSYTKSRAERSMAKAKNKDFLVCLKIILGILLIILVIAFALAVIADGCMVFLLSFNNPEDLPEFYQNQFLKITMSWAIGKGYMVFAGFGIMTIGGILIFILAVFFIKSKYFKVKANNASIVRSARKSMQTVLIDYESALRKRDEAVKNLDKYTQQLNELNSYYKYKNGDLDKNLSAQAEELTKRLSIQYRAASVLADGLKAVYGKILDERDWRNLDYIIYALETGRADSIKEGLQLVDREIQTEKLVQAMALATREICNAIDSGLANLRKDMQTCFVAFADAVGELSKQNCMIMQGVATVSGQITNMSANMSAAMSANAAALSGAVSQLSSEARLTNALIKEKNSTSEQLAEDLHMLRVQAEYDKYRKIN